MQTSSFLRPQPDCFTRRMVARPRAVKVNMRGHEAGLSRAPLKLN